MSRTGKLTDCSSQLTEMSDAKFGVTNCSKCIFDSSLASWLSGESSSPRLSPLQLDWQRVGPVTLRQWCWRCRNRERSSARLKRRDWHPKERLRKRGEELKRSAVWVLCYASLLPSHTRRFLLSNASLSSTSSASSSSSYSNLSPQLNTQQ